MENHELTWKIREYVFTDRKPFSPDDLFEKTKYESLPNDIKDAIQSLPKIDGKEYFDFSENGMGFYDDVLDGDVQLYLMEYNNRKFFIDTQGYKYARYVAELI